MLDASPEGETPSEPASPEGEADPEDAVGTNAEPETTAEAVIAGSEAPVDVLDSWVTGVLPAGGANVATGCK